MYVTDNMLLSLTTDGKEYALHILPDYDPQSPREWDNICEMACWHRRYKLGDECTHGLEPGEYLAKLVHKYEPNRDTYDMSVDELLDACIPYYEIRSLWIYDHAGLSMSFGPVDQWDSGQVGWIVAEKQNVLLCCGANEESWRTVAGKLMDDEVHMYDWYLKGEVYGFKLYERYNSKQPWTEVDCCYSFYGSDIEENGMCDYVPGLKQALEAGQVTEGVAVPQKVTSYDFRFSTEVIKNA